LWRWRAKEKREIFFLLFRIFIKKIIFFVSSIDLAAKEVKAPKEEEEEN
jgi:hypothetical protein